MLQEDKDLITAQQTDIQNVFNRFKSLRPFMGVYRRSSTAVFVTFGYSSNFASTLRVGKTNMAFIVFFNSAEDFQTQFDAAMAS